MRPSYPLMVAGQVGLPNPRGERNGCFVYVWVPSCVITAVQVDHIYTA
jgi:hypothetical protein